MSKKIIKKRPKHLTRDDRKKKRIQIMLVLLTICVCIILAFQCITSLIDKEWPVRLNYLQQPVGPGLQLIVLVTVIICGIIWLWQQMFGKKEPEQKENRKNKDSNFQYPHQRIKF